MKVAIVLLLVVLVSTALARPGKSKQGKNGFKKAVGGIPRVTEKALKRLHKLFIKVNHAADMTVAGAAMNTTDIWMLPDGARMNILVGIAMHFHRLGGAIRYLMIRGKLMVIRLFISGFVKEDRCDGVMEADMDMDMKRRLPGGYSRGEKRIMCLLRNMGEMISTFEDAAAELEEEGPIILAQLPPPCDNMLMVANDSDLVLILQALHQDFVCLKHRMAVFTGIIKDVSHGIEFESYEEVRKALIKGQILFSWMFMSTKDTLEPYFEAMRELGLGAEASMEEDDSVEDASDFEEFLEGDEESGSGESSSSVEDGSGSGYFPEYEASGSYEGMSGSGGSGGSGSGGSGSGDYAAYGSGTTVPPPMRRNEVERNVAMLIRLLMDQKK